MDNQSFVDCQQEFWEEVRNQDAIIRLSVDEIRRAANQFKWFTGTSADAFRPKHVAFLSDVALRPLSRLFATMHESGTLG